MKIEMNVRGKDFIVGDLHGCYDLLMSELEAVGFKVANGDRLFSVGDLIDRGNQNLSCLDLLKEDWFFAVRGNHENMMIDAVLNQRNINHWLQNGGRWSFDVDNSVMKKACNLVLDKMPISMEVEQISGQFIGICHAQPPDNDWYIERTPYLEQGMLWGRDWINRTEWMSVDNMYKTYHGHTPVGLPLRVGNVNFIDTGAVFNGNLTVVEME